MAKKVSSAFAVLCFLVGVCGAVYAQPPAPYYWNAPSGPWYSNYVVLKGGIFNPQGDLKGLDTGFNGELAYGFRFTPNVALEYGTGYFDASGTSRASLSRSGLSFNGDVYAIPLTIALKISLPLGNWFELYGLGGGGGYYIHSKGTFTGARGSTSRSDDSVVGGGFLGAGVTYNLTKEFFLGLEGKYLWTSNVDVKVDIGQDRFNPHFGIEGVQGTLNLGYRF